MAETMDPLFHIFKISVDASTPSYCRALLHISVCAIDRGLPLFAVSQNGFDAEFCCSVYEYE